MSDHYTGVSRIARERERQIAVEGYTESHDAQHDPVTLQSAALAYIHQSLMYWPWEPAAFKPSADHARNLEKAGALIAAAIDRLLARATTDGGQQP